MIKRKTIPLSGPRPVGLSIHRDAHGVPHIQATSLQDCLWGSGFAHVYDRGTQLLLMRIIGQGRLCELLADTDESLAIDQFFRKANWHAYLDEEVAKLDAETLIQCQAYCDGVNAGLAARKLSILRLMGVKPEPWRIQDSILISRMTSYLTLAQSQAEVERLFIEFVQAGVSSEKLAALFPVSSDFDRSLLEKIHLQERIVPQELTWNLALPRMMASNNWVISGRRTASGRPIMANDPHLEINRLPNVFCEQAWSWPASSLKGMGAPGFPGILIGRSPTVAWGVTYTFMDTVDSWVEHCKAGKYKRGSRWFAFDQRKELIKRKKHANELCTFFENKHGVLDGDPNENGFYLTTAWSAAQMGARSLQAGLALAKAETAQEAAKHLGQMESAWNWVIADNQDNIVYQMSGLMPKRDASWNGFLPAPGWQVKYDWQGMHSPEDLPRVENPSEGYIVTANQDLNHLGRVQPINMPMGDYRAQRIAQLIEADQKHTVLSSKQIQMDVYSLQAELFLNILLPLLEAKGEQSQAFTLLKSWNRKYELQSIAATFFEAFYAALRQEVFGRTKAGFGAEVLTHLSTQTGVFIDFYQNFDRVLLDPNSPWYQAQDPEQPSQKVAFLAAFEHAKGVFKELSWQVVNSIRFNNILFQGKLPAALGFDTLPLPIRGGRATPHQGQLYKSAGRQTSFGPAVRVIADLSEPSLHTCLAGGPSDNRFSPWYTSELSAWVRGDLKVLEDFKTH